MSYLNESFEKRKEDSKKILEKYKDRIPVIVTKHKTCKIKNIDKNKYLVPNDMTVGQFIYVVRKRLKLQPNMALFFYTNNKLATTSALLSQVYNDEKNEDGFLYMVYQDENTFG